MHRSNLFVSIECRRALAALLDAASKAADLLSSTLVAGRPGSSLARDAIGEMDRWALEVDRTWIQDEPLGATLIGQTLGELDGTLGSALDEETGISSEARVLIAYLKESCAVAAEFAHQLAENEAATNSEHFDAVWAERLKRADELAAGAAAILRRPYPATQTWLQACEEARSAIVVVGDITSMLAMWYFETSFSRLRFGPARVTVTGALAEGEYTLASTTTEASESIEVHSVAGLQDGKGSHLGRIYRVGTWQPQLVPDATYTLGFEAAVVALKLISFACFAGPGRDSSADLYVVLYPPFVEPTSHPTIARTVRARADGVG